jgi:aryl-alcohol dehydrogenase-like predicted oxidoreductase
MGLSAKLVLGVLGMEYRQLGKSGLQVSTIGLGTNRFGSDVVPQEQVDNIIAAALDTGINFIDTADVYTDGESERTLGKALKGRWDQVVLATKFFFPTGDGPNDKGNSRYHIFNALEASLKRLNSDHIDVYYVHRWDVDTPIDETLRALDDLIHQGKVRYIGASNFASWQLAHANLLAEMRNWAAFTALQSHYHMLERGVEGEVLPYCQSHQVGFVPYFPLAGGFLTGKYQRGAAIPAGSRGEFSQYVQGYLTDENFDVIEKLESWCAVKDRRLYELAEAWLLAQPGVASVISGATKVDHVLANAKAVDWQLSEQELEQVKAILEPGD